MNPSAPTQQEIEEHRMGMHLFRGIQVMIIILAGVWFGPKVLGPAVGWLLVTLWKFFGWSIY